MNDIIETKDLKFPPIEYGVTEAEIAEVAERYKDPDASTDEGYEHCKEGVQTLTAMRTAVETRRLDLKRPITKWIAENVDGRAKALVRQIRVAEGPVRAEKERVDEIKQAEARATAEAEQLRIDTIKVNISKIEFTAREQNPLDTASDYQTHITWLTELEITDEVFAEFVDEAKTARDAALFKLGQWHEMAVTREAEDAMRKTEREELDRKQAELDAQAEEQKAEAKRIAKGIQDAADLQAEIDRKEREAEERKADEEKAAAEKTEREAREKAIAEEKRIATIKDAIHITATVPDRATNMSSDSLDRLIRAEKDNKPNELGFQEFTAEAIDAWQQSLDRLAVMAKETRALEEKERRDEEARLPDKDKLMRWCDAIATIAEPEVLNEKAQKVLSKYSDDLNRLTLKLKSAIEKL